MRLRPPRLGSLLLSVAQVAFVVGCHPPRVAPPSAAELLAARANYPAHWWAPVSDEGAPVWEILPQEAGPGEVIVSKRHELGLLSNFAATPFTFRGRRYASLEGFWQMMLYPEGPDDPRAKFPGLEWAHTRAQVAQMTAFEAKEAGTLAERNMERMGIGWVTFELASLRLPACAAGQALRSHHGRDLGEGAAESRGQGGPARDGRSDPEAGPSSGSRRACGVALLRHPHEDPRGAAG